MKDVFLYALLLSIIFIYPIMGHSEDASEKESGRKIFVESRCYTCHTINSESKEIEAVKEEFAKAKGVELKEDNEEGDEEKKGGDLSDVGNERDVKWLTAFVQDPKDYFKDDADCKKIAKKKYRKRFKGSEAELQTLVNYLASLKYGNKKDVSDSCLKD